MTASKLVWFCSRLSVYLSLVEMNRYLIAALYVMAGCAVTIPLKAQESNEPLRGERCRLMITNTVKVVSTYLEANEGESLLGLCAGILTDYFHIPVPGCRIKDFHFKRVVRVNNGPLCRTSHRIRAPEKIRVYWIGR